MDGMQMQADMKWQQPISWFLPYLLFMEEEIIFFGLLGKKKISDWEGKISQEPFIEILKTLEEAESANLVDWNAMNIASVDQMNQPSSRIGSFKKN